MKEVLNFGIVGYGMIAKIHATCIDEIQGAKLIAICGNNQNKAESFAASYGAQVYTDYDEMLANKDIDVVCILTPSGTHAELGIAAALSGKHIIVEKPIDVTLEATDKLLETCRASNVKLCCISQHRYDPAIVELKKAVDTNQLGQLNFGVSRTTWYRSQEYYDSNKWRGTRALDGGGALINQSIHYVDLLQYIMGPVDEVFSYCVNRAHERIEVEDIAAATVKFKNGAIGLIEGNTAAYPGFSAKLEIYGSEGSVIIENDQVKEWRFKNGHVDEPPKVEKNHITGSSNANISHDSHKQQIQEFLLCIREDREPLVNGWEARKTLEIILAIYQSSKTGIPIKIK
ncbi:Gfo/Idh/MocA family protein [Fictibacillus sp. S7]|uniref:Gfo/Idh/MocA family protein n=1 Tax=Fictibacillus sp. S7 TaxID=2212476 RepID=UPI001013730B|nr:Gfo/Idh/MocA family oxidoreductase [Fictibacillus sp. S7]RXZ01524.1 gfo/Idh/MocA family oxidoreductase [Fictibacillus sp. S7]